MKNSELNYNPVWDKKSTSTGYEVTYCPDHPRAWSTGYIYTHILIAEIKINRLLRDGEVVHHKNGIRTDNSIENIDITNQSRHFKEHLKDITTKMVKLKCPNCGNVFDRERSQTFIGKKEGRYTCCSNHCRGVFSMKRHLEGDTEEVLKALSENVIEEYNARVSQLEREAVS